MGEQFLDRAVLLDQLRRGLLADAGDPRDVVGRVALQRHVLQVLRRRYAEPFLHARLVVQDDVGYPAAVEHHADPGRTSWKKSRSAVTMTASRPSSAARTARVPIASSAS